MVAAAVAPSPLVGGQPKPVDVPHDTASLEREQKQADGVEMGWLVDGDARVCVVETVEALAEP